MKEYALAIAMGLMGILACFFTCVAAEGISIDGWVVWYLAGAALMAMLAMAIGLVDTDE